MVLPLIPILIGTGIRLAAPTVAKFLMKKGFKEASKKALKKAGSNVKSISKNQATKLKPPSTTKLPKPKTTKVKFDPKKVLTKDKMVKAVSDKTRPRLPKDQIPKPPSGKVPAVRNTKVSGGKQVPAKLKKLPVATQQKIARLGGLSGVKKLGRSANPALWKKLIGAGLLAGSVAAPLIMDSKKTADATFKNKKRKSRQQISGEGEIAAGIKASGVKGPARRKQQISGEGEMAAGIKASGVKGPAKSRPSWLDNPIAKEIIKSKGGEKAFAKGSISRKIGKNIFGEGDDVTDIDKMKSSVYNELRDEYGSDTPMDSKRESFMKTLYKQKGGMVKRKYGGKIKRNMGGPAKPRKKTVFRRGGGQALRGFGKATYSNKMY